MLGLAANRLTSAWMPGPHRHDLLWVWNRFLFWFSIMFYIAVMFGGYINDALSNLVLDAIFYSTTIIIHIVNIVILRIQPVHPNKKLDWILLIYSFVISVASMCEYLVLGILIKLDKIPKDRAILRISSHALFTALIIFVVTASKEVRDSCGNVILWPVFKVKAILKKHNNVPETNAVP
uniref:Uncharacterized protein n=1 Tax=Panagrellus redivivus TaxID=6233 RepID=A0A7E4UNK5_PANRE